MGYFWVKVVWMFWGSPKNESGICYLKTTNSKQPSYNYLAILLDFHGELFKAWWVKTYDHHGY